MSLLEQLVKEIEENRIIKPHDFMKIIDNLSDDHLSYIGTYKILLDKAQKQVSLRSGQTILKDLEMTKKILPNDGLEIGDVVTAIFYPIVGPPNLICVSYKVAAPIGNYGFELVSESTPSKNLPPGWIHYPYGNKLYIVIINNEYRWALNDGMVHLYKKSLQEIPTRKFDFINT